MWRFAYGELPKDIIQMQWIGAGFVGERSLYCVIKTISNFPRNKMPMERNIVPAGRMTATFAILTLPGVTVLAVLILAGEIGFVPGLAAAVAICVISAVLTYKIINDWMGVVRWIRALSEGANPMVLMPRETALTSDTISAVAHLQRSWQRQRDVLSATTEWHEALFACLPDPVVLMGMGRKVTGVNLAARKAFGRDITGRDLSVVLRAPEVLESADAVLDGEMAREIEFTLPVPVERTYVARIQRLGNMSNDGTMAILALHDITTMRRIEQMRADFVANASHELRTPLSTLLGFIETLRGPARDDVEARDRFLTIMLEQASRMARLVRDLLSLSRIELNEHSPPQDRVEIVHLAETALEAMEPIAAGRHMKLVLDAKDPNLEVFGQDDELTQLLQNLLDNALKYGREGTDVTVSVKLAERLPAVAAHLGLGSAVVVSVMDKGEGIAREHLPRLTERFYRVDAARSRSLGGTGLGLAIVKHIVNRHRGALVVDSTPGVGSTFSVYLQVALPIAAVLPLPETRTNMHF